MAGDTAARLAVPCRWLLGAVFLVSGMAKVADRERFLLTLREFRLLPGALESFFAVYLPWLELVLGLCLLLGLLHRTAALLVAALNGAFVLAIASVLARGIDVDCGCFGLLADALHLPDHADGTAIARNVVFIAMCVAVYRADAVTATLEGYLARRRADERN